MDIIKSRAKVFISYSHSDSRFVNRLSSDLKINHFTVLVEGEGIQGGQDWASYIERSLIESDVVLIVISPEAIQSRWVQTEMAYASHANKRIIPLLLRPAQVPMMIINLQQVDFTNESNYDKTLNLLVSSIDQFIMDPGIRTVWEAE